MGRTYDIGGMHGFGTVLEDEERTIVMRIVEGSLVSDDTVVAGISISDPTTRLFGEWYREEVPDLVC